MPCEIEHRLQAYHDRELSSADRAAIDLHLAQCAPCRDSLAQLQQFSTLISAAPPPALPASARIRFYAAWDDAQSFRDRSVLRIASWLTAVAAAILVGGLISLNWPNNTGGTPNRIGQWETVAVLPPADVSAENGSTTELIRVAQWQADDLAVGDKTGDIRSERRGEKRGGESR